MRNAAALFRNHPTDFLSIQLCALVGWKRAEAEAPRFRLVLFSFQQRRGGFGRPFSMIICLR